MLDPLLLPWVDRYPVSAANLITAGLCAVLWVLGRLLFWVFPPMSLGHGTALAPAYAAVNWVGGGWWDDPLFPSLLSVGFYHCLMVPFTVLDLLRPAVVQKSYMVQPRPPGDFGDPPALGLGRALTRQLLNNVALVPAFAMIAVRGGPSLYADPWVPGGPCIADCGPLPMPQHPPTVVEFAVHMAFCLVCMDAAFFYWHWMAHRHRAIYVHLHSLHHQYRAPFAWITQYAHPAEVAMAAFFSLIPPIACGAHPFTLNVWVLWSIWLSVDAHVGYETPLSLKYLTCGVFAGTSHHDVHHQKPSTNFQPFLTYLDRFMGTNREQ